ncbi:hypothetical protein HOLleu_33980 [Holothuria leucospilota]|uniref:Uncharacterized protein n=1 Tax=Holothuria leucospilota TaxID=206669 RepID=A0A9Q0YPK8_HOLLE|nr:hypothetical protein HOLleu_33980 [Holothuria leucospilota]
MVAAGCSPQLPSPFTLHHILSLTHLLVRSYSLSVQPGNFPIKCGVFNIVQVSLFRLNKIVNLVTLLSNSLFVTVELCTTVIPISKS